MRLLRSSKHYTSDRLQSFKIIFLFAPSSGLRSSELVELTMDDIDEEKRMSVSKRPSRAVSSRSPCLAADYWDHGRHAEIHTHP